MQKRKQTQKFCRKLDLTFRKEGMTKMPKMRYFEHVMRAHQSLEEDINAGNNCSSKKKTEAPYAWMDDITSVTGLSLNDLNHLVKDNSVKYTVVRKIKRTNFKSKKKAMANHSFQNAAQYIRKDHEESYRLDGLHHHLHHQLMLMKKIGKQVYCFQKIYEQELSEFTITITKRKHQVTHFYS